MSVTPLDAAVAAAGDAPIGTVTYLSEQFTVAKRPNGLLLAELTRMDSGDADALGILVEFFVQTLGRDEYRRFRTLFFAQHFDSIEASVEALSEVVQDVVEVATGRPTE